MVKALKTYIVNDGKLTSSRRYWMLILNTHYRRLE